MCLDWIVYHVGPLSLSHFVAIILPLAFSVSQLLRKRLDRDAMFGSLLPV